MLKFNEYIKESFDYVNIYELLITYETPEEAKNVADKMISDGYKVLDYNTIEEDASKWDCFIYHVNCFVLARVESFLKNKSDIISAQKFLYGKELKRKKNLILDPYDEDFWGYEED